MQFALNSDQTLLKDTLERFLRERYASTQPRFYRDNPVGYGAANWQGLAELGVLGLPFATEDGGLGGGPRELCIVLEAVGRALAVEPVLEELVLAAGALSRLGDSAQRAQWLPRVMSGDAHLALAHFEHAARYNLHHVEATAHARSGGRYLDGEKSLVPLACAADAWIVSARDGSAADPSSIGFYLVSPDAGGIERRDYRLADGAVASSIRFRGVPTLARLPGDYDEFATVIDTARLAAGAEMIGVMSTLFQSTLEYLRSRKQFGAPLSSFQAIQHRLADLYVLLEQSRSHLYRATLAMEAPGNAARTVAGMKTYIGNAAVTIGEECVHLHGGIGTTDELALGHGYKRLLVLVSLFGDTNAELSRFIRMAS